MNQKQVVEKVTEILTPVLEDLVIWDIEMAKEGKNLYLRVYIDREPSDEPEAETGEEHANEGEEHATEGEAPTPQGIGIEDCERISRHLSAVLDELDPITDPYMLEVSSPGLTRALKTPAHFARFIGHDVDVTLYKPYNNKKLLTGELVSFENQVVTLFFDDAEHTFEQKALASVKLAIDF